MGEQGNENWGFEILCSAQKGTSCEDFDGQGSDVDQTLMQWTEDKILGGTELEIFN